MSKQKSMSGYFIISLDFELMWGMFDKVNMEDYGANLRGVHTAIPRLLTLFTEHNIHATWATVGLVSAYHIAELNKLSPLTHEQPKYVNPAFSPYEHLQTFREQIDDNLDSYLAPELIERILDTPGQELASHSFSHYYCLEKQETDTDPTTVFAADALAVHNAFARFAVEPKSMVFPRNQWTTEALGILERLKYLSYRGTERHFLYQARDEASKTKFVLRGLRFLDRYLNLTGHHIYRVQKPLHDQPKVINLPASRQLHPASKWLRFLEPLKLFRIKRGMTKAAKRGKIFHLWWHPHNFGTNLERNMSMLKKILDHHTYLARRYDWKSGSMQEVATAYLESLAPSASADEDQPAPASQ